MDKYAFEQKFRTLLDKHDFSQARLARRLHVSRSTISKWITGENQISYEMLRTLCEIFDLDADEQAEWLVLAGYPPVVESRDAATLPAKRQTYDAILYVEPGNLRSPGRLFGFEYALVALTSQLDRGQQILITGYGGTGKTALAATIADERLATGKGPVLWLNAQVNELATLLEALLVPFNAHQELTNLRGDARLYMVRQVLTREEVGVVVLDDLRQVQLFAEIQRAIPKTVGLLITSRHTIANIDQMIPVPQLAPHAAVQLLASHAANRAIDEHSYQVDPQAAALCARLNAHPLGIVIAGAWLKQRESSIGDLLARLASSNTDLLTLEIPPEFGREDSATVKLVLDQTYRELSKDGQSLFRSFGVLQEPKCTADFLALYSGLDEWKLHNALDELIAWNYLERADDSFYSMHDVIHSYVEHRTRTIRHVETNRLTAAVQRYLAANALDFARLHQNLPNILSTAESADDDECLAIVTYLALDGYQDHFGYRLSYLELLDRGLRHLLTKHEVGTLSKDEGKQVHHLLTKRGNACFDQKDYHGAAEAYHNALTFAYNPERRAIVLSLIAKALRFAGDLSGSETGFQQAYATVHTTSDPFLLCFVLEQEAHAAGFHGDHGTARRVAVEQVEIGEMLVQSDATEHNRIRLFYAYNNLATAELNLGQMALADVLQIAQSAASLATDLCSEELTAHAAWVLTEIYHALGDRAAAAQQLHRAQHIYEAQGKLLDADQTRHFMQEHGYEA